MTSQSNKLHCVLISNLLSLHNARLISVWHYTAGMPAQYSQTRYSLRAEQCLCNLRVYHQIHDDISIYSSQSHVCKYIIIKVIMRVLAIAPQQLR